MRRLMVLAFLANVFLVLVSLTVLPERVPIHFGIDGTANGWASKEVSVILFLGTNTGVLLMMLYVPALIRKLPSSMVNLPNREYWLNEKNVAVAQAKIGRFMSELGCAIFVFLFCVEMMTLEASMAVRPELNMGVFWPVLVLFMTYTTWWTIRLYRAFRIPRSETLSSE